MITKDDARRMLCLTDEDLERLPPAATEAFMGNGGAADLVAMIEARTDYQDRTEALLSAAFCLGYSLACRDMYDAQQCGLSLIPEEVHAAGTRAASRQDADSPR